MVAYPGNPGERDEMNPLQVVYYDVDGDVQEEGDCDECGAVFSVGVMALVGETLDEVSGRLVPECKLFCGQVCSTTWRRKRGESV